MRSDMDHTVLPAYYTKFGPPHTTGSNWEGKLKFGMSIDMHMTFNTDENFLC